MVNPLDARSYGLGLSLDQGHCIVLLCFARFYINTSTVIKQLVHAFTCAVSSYLCIQEVWKALLKLELLLANALCNSCASFVLSKLPMRTITR